MRRLYVKMLNPSNTNFQFKIIFLRKNKINYMDKENGFFFLILSIRQNNRIDKNAYMSSFIIIPEAI